MITCVTYENLGKTAGIFNSQFQLRYRCFIERQNYDVKVYGKKEYDQYDTPATVYLVSHDKEGDALGVSRLIPVKQACMINDLWPEMLHDKSILCSDHLWEATRFCIDKNLDVSVRKRIAQELVLSYLEFGLQAGAKAIIGVMPKLILRTVFGACGVAYIPLGKAHIIDGVAIQAAGMDINYGQLRKVQQTTGIHSSVFIDGSCEDRWKVA